MSGAKNPLEFEGIFCNLGTLLGPRNFSGTCISVFFLEEHSAVGGDIAAGLIYKGHFGVIGCQRIEDDLPAFTTPNFDNVNEHAIVLFIAGRQRDLDPFDRDLIWILRIASGA